MKTIFMHKNDDPLWLTIYDLLPVAVLILLIVIMFLLEKYFLGSIR